MNSLIYYLKKAFTIPPYILLHKMYTRISIKINNNIQRKKDINGNTHINFNVKPIVYSYININDFDISSLDFEVIHYLNEMYCNHRFDLLGSGWVKNSYSSDALGLEDYRYEMNTVAPKSVDVNYEPIDWQKDFKSGYRWSEKVWCKDQRNSFNLGADIKVPWELARMQHLPQLAIFSIKDDALLEKNIYEFKNQILDFIENNPPRMGVNWVCTMDVGIRAANMLIAYDMFSQLDNCDVLDTKFKQIFSNSIYEHGLHIINNLEYSAELTSNHYLSNIVGLLYIGAYLNNIEWISISVNEIKNEFEKQFYEDGGNFESSTSYHRLSGELIVYATALIIRLQEEKKVHCVEYKVIGQRFEQVSLQEQVSKPLSQEYIDKLFKVGRFTLDITKPNGDIIQFGDNDSGRFFKLSPNGTFVKTKQIVKKYQNLKSYNDDNEFFWDENILNHSTFISAVYGLYDSTIFLNTTSFESSFVKSIASIQITESKVSYTPIKLSSNIVENKFSFKRSLSFEIKVKLDELDLIYYPQSGIYIYKAQTFYLAICATPLGQKGRGGHTHNNKLSFELYSDEKDIAKSSGTYIYTPLPNKRNNFRSVHAHNVPIILNTEQNRFNGNFGMHNDTNLTLLSQSKFKVEFMFEYQNIKVMRCFEIMENELIITDQANSDIKYSDFKLYSSGYGKFEQI
jgi:hypothetical protein